MIKIINLLSTMLVIISVVAISGCGTKTKNTDTETASQAKTTEPAINAKAVMDKVHATLDGAVESKMEQLESIDVVDIYNNPDAYLAMNAKNKGIITTASGLQYRVLTAGTGPKPDSSSTVAVHYRGTFPDGREFDSSYKRGEPTSFPVTGVIRGWTEALLMMNEGSKWELVIPPNLAYGETGAGNVIPPNQVLKFDVELINANK